MKLGILDLCMVLQLILPFADLALAELAWESKVIKLSADFDQEVVHAEFTFKNVGEDEISITTVRPSCGCTTAALNKSTYEAGEEGQIAVTLDLSGRLGLRKERITVYTTELEKEPTLLTLEVKIPEIYMSSPKCLTWKKSGPGEWKIFRLKNVLQTPVKIIEVQCRQKSFLAELKVLRHGFEYELGVTPVDMSRPTTGIICLMMDYKVNNRSKVQKLYVYIEK